MRFNKLLIMIFKARSRYTAFLLISALLFSTNCSEASNDPVRSDGEPKSVSVTIDLAKAYQTIDNFGASDAWSCQFVGNWPDVKKNAIADLLFSTEVSPDGQPKGIGLSLWRFNVGAGSAQQGDKSGIKDEWRRAESFLNSDGSYNWKNQSGQMWFLQAAKKRGVEQYLAFPNSPPVQFTNNAKAYANSGKPNLLPDKFDAFASFLTDVVKGVQKETGILFNYVSPVNEPQWDWSDGGQEGTPFTNSDISGIVKSLNTALLKQDMPTKIIVSEAGQYEFLYSPNGKADKGTQIDTFFKPGSSDYIGNLQAVDKIIAGHSYFTTSPFNKAVSIRKQVSDKVSAIGGLKFWQSEYCILGDNAGEIRGEKRDLGIAPALYLARTIHTDLVTANATAWHWWIAISPYDYKDGLVYVDKNKSDGNYYASKMLWAVGNYSRFIRPNAVRVNVASSDIASGNNLLLISSFKDPSTKKLTTVVVNSGVVPVNLKLEIENGRVPEVQPYITSAESDLKASNPLQTSKPIVIQPRTITTLIGGIQ